MGAAPHGSPHLDSATNEMKESCLRHYVDEKDRADLKPPLIPLQ
jgi:hypothetical protein